MCRYFDVTENLFLVKFKSEFKHLNKPRCPWLTNRAGGVAAWETGHTCPRAAMPLLPYAPPDRNNFTLNASAMNKSGRCK
jgi:hypothetical protein